MNAQELFEAFRDVDPAWLKEADQRADRAAEQFSVTEAQDAAENEIQQIFAKDSGCRAKETARRITEYQTEAKAPVFAGLTGTPAGIPAVRSAPAPVPADQGSSRVFRALGAIAAAVALVSIGAFANSVLSNRNSGMTVPPAAQVPSEQPQDITITADGSEHYLEVNGAGDYIIGERSAVTRYNVTYQDLSMIDKHVTMYDGATYIMSSQFEVPNIYQPEGTPVELTLSPSSADSLIPGSHYRVVAEQGSEVLDITDSETGDSFKTYEFTTTDDVSESTHKITVTPNYLDEGSEIKLFIIVSDQNKEYSCNDSCMFRLYKAEPGAPCTYSVS